MEKSKPILQSYYMIRKIIGILGIMLPLLVFLFHGDFLSSVSHYYYTRSSLFFTSVLTAFGLFLISYKGYEKDRETEFLSDNQITHIGGTAALLVVLIPTSASGSNSPDINNMCIIGSFPMFGHNNSLLNTIHLLSAGIFLLIMGWMSFFRFTKGELTPGKRRKNVVYRSTGYIIWVSIFVLMMEFVIGYEITKYDVIILETISVLSFGISWLIKGKAIEDLLELRIRFLKIF
jgi:hypothetical protein